MWVRILLGDPNLSKGLTMQVYYIRPASVKDEDATPRWDPNPDLWLEVCANSLEQAFEIAESHFEDDPRSYFLWKKSKDERYGVHHWRLTR
jgi:hypothetical protein